MAADQAVRESEDESDESDGGPHSLGSWLKPSLWVLVEALPKKASYQKNCNWTYLEFKFAQVSHMCQE